MKNRFDLELILPNPLFLIFLILNVAWFLERFIYCKDYNKYIFKNGGKTMATPIGDTPVLIGKESENFLNGLDKPLTKKEKELQKIRRGQRFVPF